MSRSEVHIEITTRCRLSCPKCFRTSMGKDLEIHDIPVSTVKKIVDSGKYNFVFLIGTLGDCIYHPNFLEIVKVIKDKKLVVDIHTNGSGKDLNFWNQLFSLLDKDDLINFTMDGYYDTSSIYRINFKKTDFEKNIQAMKLGKQKYGLDVRWLFIPFIFNEHQIKQAAQLAIDNQITFVVRKSKRWELDKEDPLKPKNKNLVSYPFNNK